MVPPRGLPRRGHLGGDRRGPLGRVRQAPPRVRRLRDRRRLRRGRERTQDGPDAAARGRRPPGLVRPRAPLPGPRGDRDPDPPPGHGDRAPALVGRGRLVRGRPRVHGRVEHPGGGGGRLRFAPRVGPRPGGRGLALHDRSGRDAPLLRGPGRLRGPPDLRPGRRPIPDPPGLPPGRDRGHRDR